MPVIRDYQLDPYQKKQFRKRLRLLTDLAWNDAINTAFLYFRKNQISIEEFVKCVGAFTRLRREVLKIPFDTNIEKEAKVELVAKYVRLASSFLPYKDDCKSVCLKSIMDASIEGASLMFAMTKRGPYKKHKQPGDDEMPN